MEQCAKKPLFEYIISRLNLRPDCRYFVLDFGCGSGEFLALLSKELSVESRLLGVDGSEQFIQTASERYPYISFACRKFDGKFDFPDASFDIIVTIDAIECISDKSTLVNEFHRILKPDGNLLAAHWDWDTMVYSAKCKDIARHAVSAFSEWKQPWMDNCDGQMGRKLWGLFEGSGKFRGKPDSFNLLETTYRAGTYGFDRMQDTAKLIDKGKIGQGEYEKLHRELIEQNEKRQYFFSLTSFLYQGEKLISAAEQDRVRDDARAGGIIMLTTKDAIERRRSIRKFKPDNVPDEYIVAILDAARLAPSGCNAQPWRFKIVKDRETKLKLARAAFNQSFIDEAPVIMVCCADIKAYLEGTVSGLQDLGKTGSVEDRISKIILDRTNKMKNLNTDQLGERVALNAAIAVEHAVLRALDFGLGSCWVRLVDRQRIKEIFSWNDNLYVVALLPIGYPAESPAPRKRLKLEEIMIE